MKERPILFSGPMVRALLAGTKTQTRRVFKAKNGGVWPNVNDIPGMAQILRNCPYGKPGDRLWVRETFAKIDGQTRHWIETDYKATYTHGDRLGDSLGIRKKWSPSIHMPRHASRIALEITGVRVERLQDISEADAVAEGMPRYASHPTEAFHSQYRNPQTGNQYLTAKHAYQSLWESINGPGSWDANPWVWVVEFRRLT